MKILFRMYAIALGAYVLIGTVCSGCVTADDSNSMTAEFPIIERWWK